MLARVAFQCCPMLLLQCCPHSRTSVCTTAICCCARLPHVAVHGCHPPVTSVHIAMPCCHALLPMHSAINVCAAAQCCRVMLQPSCHEPCALLPAVLHPNAATCRCRNAAPIHARLCALLQHVSMQRCHMLHCNAPSIPSKVRALMCHVCTLICLAAMHYCPRLP
jgi:hypothetical protein